MFWIYIRYMNTNLYVTVSNSLLQSHVCHKLFSEYLIQNTHSRTALTVLTALFSERLPSKVRPD